MSKISWVEYFNRLIISICLVLEAILVSTCSLEEQAEDIPDDSCEEKVTLSGTITSPYSTSAYQVLLIKGIVDSTSLQKANYQWDDAQVFVTGKDNRYEFKNLPAGTYTLCVTKSRYKPNISSFTLSKNYLYPHSVFMQRDGHTQKIEILNDDGENVSEIEFRRNTFSVYFYLFNPSANPVNYSIYALPEGYIGKSIIIDGKVVHLYSPWVQEIKFPSKVMAPYEITLVEVVIDPLLYAIKDHSRCQLIINYDSKVTLSY